MHSSARHRPASISRNSRSPTRVAPLLAAVALMLTAAAASGQGKTPPPPDSSRSVADGAYTSEQATRGEAMFRSTCGNCHSVSQFTGPTFLRIWSDRPVYELFDQLRNTMPLDNPGGLKREDYAAVIAYILELNDYPAGTTELPSTDAHLRLIRFQSAKPRSN